MSHANFIICQLYKVSWASYLKSLVSDYTQISEWFQNVQKATCARTWRDVSWYWLCASVSSKSSPIGLPTFFILHKPTMPTDPHFNHILSHTHPCNVRNLLQESCLPVTWNPHKMVKWTSQKPSNWTTQQPWEPSKDSNCFKKFHRHETKTPSDWLRSLKG